MSLEEVPEAVAEEDDNETLDARAEMAEVEDDDVNEDQEIVMEDITENPVIAANDDVNEEDEEDDEWDQNPYNFVDLSDTASETGSNVDPDIFYSIIDFDRKFEEELHHRKEADQSESCQDSSNNNSFSGS